MPNKLKTKKSNSAWDATIEQYGLTEEFNKSYGGGSSDDYKKFIKELGKSNYEHETFSDDEILAMYKKYFFRKTLNDFYGSNRFSKKGDLYSLNDKQLSEKFIRDRNVDRVAKKPYGKNSSGYNSANFKKFKNDNYGADGGGYTDSEIYQKFTESNYSGYNTADSRNNSLPYYPSNPVGGQLPSPEYVRQNPSAPKPKRTVPKTSTVQSNPTQEKLNQPIEDVNPADIAPKSNVVQNIQTGSNIQNPSEIQAKSNAALNAIMDTSQLVSDARESYREQHGEPEPDLNPTHTFNVNKARRDISIGLINYDAVQPNNMDFMNDKIQEYYDRKEALSYESVKNKIQDNVKDDFIDNQIRSKRNEPFVDEFIRSRSDDELRQYYEDRLQVDKAFQHRYNNYLAQRIKEYQDHYADGDQKIKYARDIEDGKDVSKVKALLAYEANDLGLALSKMSRTEDGLRDAIIKNSTVRGLIGTDLLPADEIDFTKILEIINKPIAREEWMKAAELVEEYLGNIVGSHQQVFGQSEAMIENNVKSKSYVFGRDFVSGAAEGAASALNLLCTPIYAVQAIGDDRSFVDHLVNNRFMRSVQDWTEDFRGDAMVYGNTFESEFFKSGYTIGTMSEIALEYVLTGGLDAFARKTITKLASVRKRSQLKSILKPGEKARLYESIDASAENLSKLARNEEELQKIQATVDGIKGSIEVREKWANDYVFNQLMQLRMVSEEAVTTAHEVQKDIYDRAEQYKEAAINNRVEDYYNMGLLELESHPYEETTYNKYLEKMSSNIETDLENQYNAYLQDIEAKCSEVGEDNVARLDDRVIINEDGKQYVYWIGDKVKDEIKKNLYGMYDNLAQLYARSEYEWNTKNPDYDEYIKRQADLKADQFFVDQLPLMYALNKFDMNRFLGPTKKYFGKNAAKRGLRNRFDDFKIDAHGIVTRNKSIGSVAKRYAKGAAKFGALSVGEAVSETAQEVIPQGLFGEFRKEEAYSNIEDFIDDRYFGSGQLSLEHDISTLYPNLSGHDIKKAWYTSDANSVIRSTMLSTLFFPSLTIPHKGSFNNNVRTTYDPITYNLLKAYDAMPFRTGVTDIAYEMASEEHSLDVALARLNAVTGMPETSEIYKAIIGRHNSAAKAYKAFLDGDKVQFEDKNFETYLHQAILLATLRDSGLADNTISQLELMKNIKSQDDEHKKAAIDNLTQDNNPSFNELTDEQKLDEIEKFGNDMLKLIDDVYKYNSEQANVDDNEIPDEIRLMNIYRKFAIPFMQKNYQESIDKINKSFDNIESDDNIKYSTYEGNGKVSVEESDGKTKVINLYDNNESRLLSNLSKVTLSAESIKSLPVQAKIILFKNYKSLNKDQQDILIKAKGNNSEIESDLYYAINRQVSIDASEKAFNDMMRDPQDFANRVSKRKQKIYKRAESKIKDSLGMAILDAKTMNDLRVVLERDGEQRRSMQSRPIFKRMVESQSDAIDRLSSENDEIKNKIDILGKISKFSSDIIHEANSIIVNDNRFKDNKNDVINTVRNTIVNNILKLNNVKDLFNIQLYDIESGSVEKDAISGIIAQAIQETMDLNNITSVPIEETQEQQLQSDDSGVHEDTEVRDVQSPKPSNDVNVINEIREINNLIDKYNADVNAAKNEHNPSQTTEGQFNEISSRAQKLGISIASDNGLINKIDESSFEKPKDSKSSDVVNGNTTVDRSKQVVSDESKERVSLEKIKDALECVHVARQILDVINSLNSDKYESYVNRINGYIDNSIEYIKSVCKDNGYDDIVDDNGDFDTSNMYVLSESHKSAIISSLLNDSNNIIDDSVIQSLFNVGSDETKLLEKPEDLFSKEYKIGDKFEFNGKQYDVKQSGGKSPRLYVSIPNPLNGKIVVRYMFKDGKVIEEKYNKLVSEYSSNAVKSNDNISQFNPNAINDLKESSRGKTNPYSQEVRNSNVTPAIQEYHYDGMSSAHQSNAEYTDESTRWAFDILKSCGAFEYLNRGHAHTATDSGLKATEVTFTVTTEIINGEERRIIWIITKDEVKNANNGNYKESFGNHQVLNVLDSTSYRASSDRQANTDTPRGRLIADIDYEYANKGDGVFVYSKSFKITKIRGGQPRLVNESNVNDDYVNKNANVLLDRDSHGNYGFAYTTTDSNGNVITFEPISIARDLGRGNVVSTGNYVASSSDIKIRNERTAGLTDNPTLICTPTPSGHNLCYRIQLISKAIDGYKDIVRRSLTSGKLGKLLKNAISNRIVNGASYSSNLSRFISFGVGVSEFISKDHNNSNYINFGIINNNNQSNRFNVFFKASLISVGENGSRTYILRGQDDVVNNIISSKFKNQSGFTKTSFTEDELADIYVERILSDDNIDVKPSLNVRAIKDDNSILNALIDDGLLYIPNADTNAFGPSNTGFEASIVYPEPKASEPKNTVERVDSMGEQPTFGQPVQNNVSFNDVNQGILDDEIAGVFEEEVEFNIDEDIFGHSDDFDLVNNMNDQINRSEGFSLDDSTDSLGIDGLDSFERNINRDCGA